MSLGPDPNTSRRAGKAAWANRQAKERGRTDPFVHYLMLERLEREREKTQAALGRIVAHLTSEALAAYDAKVREHEAKKDARGTGGNDE